MRTSVINRFAKLAPLSVATLLLTSGITLITADTAWACGDQPSSAAAEQPREQHAGEPSVLFVGNTPKKITAGGAKVEFTLSLHNGTGSAYKRIAPHLALWNPQSGFGDDVAGLSKAELRQVHLRPQDITVEAKVNGQWKNLPLRRGCDPLLNADTSALNGPLADGQSKQFTFRIGLKSSAPAVQKSFHLYAADLPTTVTVVRPTTPPKPATPKPTPSATKAAAPAAAVAEAPKPTPSASVTATPAAEPAATPAELASTGPKAPTAALVGSAAALLAVGTAALLFARRRTAR
ncbi:hypothetical protein [Kitasatospora sp. NPDC004289]